MDQNISDKKEDEIEPIWKKARKLDSAEDEQVRVDKMAGAIKTLIECMGEDVSRDGLIKTPHRSAKALLHFTSGYKMNIKDVVNDALFNIESDETTSNQQPDDECNEDISGMVVVRDIEVQERLTKQIASAIDEVTCPVGVGVVIECSHMCMCMRGVNQVQSTTLTNTFKGKFKTDFNLRKEFLDSVKSK